MSQEVTAAMTPAPGPSSSAAPMTLEDATKRLADLERAIGMAHAQSQPDGILGRFGNWLLGASWRTSVASYASFVGLVGFALVTQAPDLLPASIAKWAPFLPLIAQTVGLRLAKDVQTSGVAKPPA